MPYGKILKTFLALVALGVAIVAMTIWSDAHGPAPQFPHAALIIKRADGKSFTYNVEVATTLRQDMYGLMFRKSLPADAGMIFVYNPDMQVSMWMKNTYVPLDMLFVRRDGIIDKIITHAQPLDLTPLSADEPVHGVIELNAGDAAKNGFKVGDKIIFPGFGGPA